MTENTLRPYTEQTMSFILLVVASSLQHDEAEDD